MKYKNSRQKIKSIRPDKETIENKKLLIKHGYSQEQVDRMDILQLTELALELSEPIKKECEHKRVITTPNGWEMWICPDCHNVVEFKPTPSPIEEIKHFNCIGYVEDELKYPSSIQIVNKIDEIIDRVNSLSNK